MKLPPAMGLLLGVWAGLIMGSAAEPTNRPPASPARQVLAVYFHGTIRCVECLKIEEEARRAIEQTFTNALATRQLEWRSINYELPQHAQALQTYRLPCPSLVILMRTNGVDERWQLLGETWKLVEDVPRFRAYITNAVGDYLRQLK